MRRSSPAPSSFLLSAALIVSLAACGPYEATSGLPTVAEPAFTPAVSSTVDPVPEAVEALADPLGPVVDAEALAEVPPAPAEEPPAPAVVSPPLRVKPVARPAATVVSPAPAPAPVAPVVVTPAPAPAPVAPVIVTSAPAPAPALLEVHNARREPVTLSLDELSLGRVAPGMVVRFPALAPGRVTLLARDRQGRVVAEQRLLLRSGLLQRWEILTRAGALELYNPSPSPVALQLDGVALGRWAGGERRRVAEVAPGLHRLRGERPFAPAQEVTVRVGEGEVVTWAVPLDPPAILRVLSAGPAPLELFADGRALARLLPGRPLRLELPPGPVALSAVAPDRLVVDRTRRTLRAGQEERWQITQGPPPVAARPARLLLVNEASESLQLELDGRAVGLLGRGQTLERTLPAGRVRLVGQGQESGARYALELTLRPGAVQRASFATRQAELLLLERGGTTLELRVDGRPAGVLTAGGQRRLLLPLGRHRLEAVPRQGAGRLQQDVVVTERGARLELALPRPRVVAKAPLREVPAAPVARRIRL